MKLVTPALYAALRANCVARSEQLQQVVERFDPVPVLRLFVQGGDKPGQWSADDLLSAAV